jgi:hypothetical protein
MRQPRPCFQRLVFAWAGRGRQGERPGVRTCSVRPRTRCCDRRQGMPATADRSTGAVWAMGWLLGGGGWPPGQLPPAMDHPPPAPAARWASATRKPCLGGLLSPFGDALVGQHLAQPGMLVVHVPSLPAAQPSLFQRQVSGRQGCGTDPFGEQDCPSPMAGFASRSGRGDASRPTAAGEALAPGELTRPPVIRGFALCLPLSVPGGRGGRATTNRWWRMVMNAQVRCHLRECLYLPSFTVCHEPSRDSLASSAARLLPRRLAIRGAPCPGLTATRLSANRRAWPDGRSPRR